MCKKKANMLLERAKIKMFDIKIVEDLKEIHNLGRIQSKKLLNLLDLIELALKKRSMIFFSYTINVGFFNEIQKDLMKTWVEDLESFIDKLNDFINKDVENQFTMYSIEMHRAKRTLIKKSNKITPVKKENSLKGYPHIHIFSAYNVENIDDMNHKKYVIESKILDFFLNYDIKINNIEKKKHNIKNSIKYIIKEYKFTDTINNLNQLGLKNNIQIFVNESWNDLKKGLNCLNKIKDLNIDFIYKKDCKVVESVIKDPLYKLKILFENSLRKGDLKLYKSNIYSPIKGLYDSRALVFHKTLDDYLNKMAVRDLSNSSLILSQRKSFSVLIKESCKSLYEGNLFPDLEAYFNLFNYIEYKEFYLNLHRAAIENKYGDSEYREWHAVVPFKYYEKTKEDLLGLQGGVDLLRNIFNNDEDFFSYLLFMGKLLTLSYKSVKNKTLYLYGPSNSGKTLLTEKFLREIFGDENIGILNTSDSKFFLDQICDKHIIILNEFKYSPNNRELLLKFLDGSLIPINRKYKDSVKITLDSFTLATSNLSIKEQRMDEAFNNRLLSLQTKNTVTPLMYSIIIESLPLIILYFLFSLLVPDYKNLEVYVYNQLENSSKSITVV